MNKIRFFTIAVLFLLALNAITLYFLFQKRGDRHSLRNGGRPYSEFISKQLKFDTAQTTQLKQLRDKHKLQLDELRKQDKQLQTAKFTLLKDAATDSLQIDSLLNLIAENKKQFEKAFYQHFMEIRTLCRPDQLELFNKTLDEMMKRRMQPPGGDRDKRPPGPPPGN